jgi:hypothetical protein
MLGKAFQTSLMSVKVRLQLALQVSTKELGDGITHKLAYYKY